MLRGNGMTRDEFVERMRIENAKLNQHCARLLRESYDRADETFLLLAESRSDYDDGVATP